MVADSSAVALARVAAQAAHEVKAEQVIALDVSERLVLTDAFVVASADNERQVRAVVEAIDEAVSRAGGQLRRREGMDQLRWVLLDFGELVVHVQHSEDREFYALEKLWSDCPAIPVADCAAQDA